MSTRQFLINASTKHQIFLLRYAGSTFNQMLPFIDDTINKAIMLLSKAKTDFSKTRYTTLLKELQQVQLIIYNNMAKSTRKQALSLAKYEADFTKRMVESSITNSSTFIAQTPTVNQLKDAALTSIMDTVPGFNKQDGTTIGKALEDFGKQKASELVREVRTGFALGQTTSDIAKSLMSTIGVRIKNQAYALARTITNHVANTSRLEFYKENADIIIGYQVIATLDNKTSLTCINLDHEIFKPEDFIEPPYHWNCRSTFIGVIDPSLDAGPMVKGDRVAKGANGMISHINTNTSYKTWLKDQPDAFKIEVLGVQRTKLFNAGMGLDKFVDHNYKPITLDQLKDKDNEHIFNKAGILND